MVERLRYFLPDWDDRVDPAYDFEFELSKVDRDRWKEDVYAHEFFGEDTPYDGILVSRAALEQNGAKRDEVNRIGLRNYLRLPRRFELLGDCGAFGYVNEPKPIFQTPDVLEFYQHVGVDYGVSIDHIIFPAFPEQREYRYNLTIANAVEFLERSRAARFTFTPVGAVQGWDVPSYISAARELAQVGYSMLAIGGLVRSKTPDILAIASGVAAAVGPSIRIHLFGVARDDIIPDLARIGVFSFDSASPMRTSWMSASKNYLAGDDHYTAIRIPYTKPETQGVRGDNILSRSNSQTPYVERQRLERAALDAVRAYARHDIRLDQAMTAIEEYDREQARRTDSSRSRASRMWNYRRTLKDRPWTRCSCRVCTTAGVEVVIFRGNNRNRRRGFHNVRNFYQTLRMRERQTERATHQFSLGF
jgi:hypothetical protein